MQDIIARQQSRWALIIGAVLRRRRRRSSPHFPLGRRRSSFSLSMPIIDYIEHETRCYASGAQQKKQWETVAASNGSRDARCYLWDSTVRTDIAGAAVDGVACTGDISSVC